MKNSFKLFSYKESPIYLKYWFFLLLLFIPINFVIILFISILVHEMAHVWMANKLGYKSEYIELSIFTGQAKIDEKFLENNKDIIKISVVGPLSNLMLCIVSLGVYVFLELLTLMNPIISDFLVKFFLINLILSASNLIPIYPTDGGRISKSFLSMIFGNNKGKVINGILSLIISIICLILSFYFNFYFLMLFIIFFIIISISEIRNKEIKK